MDGDCELAGKPNTWASLNIFCSCTHVSCRSLASRRVSTAQGLRAAKIIDWEDAEGQSREQRGRCSSQSYSTCSNPRTLHYIIGRRDEPSVPSSSDLQTSRLQLRLEHDDYCFEPHNLVSLRQHCLTFSGWTCVQRSHDSWIVTRARCVTS